MKTIEQSVKEFHEKYGHFIANKIGIPPQPIKDLRMSLCLEEMNEFITAVIRNDLGEIADGAADLIYVLVGTCISYGIPIDRIFQEVHRSNMTKTPVKAAEGEKYGTKTPKGPDYKAPQIDKILRFPLLATDLEHIHQD